MLYGSRRSWRLFLLPFCTVAGVLSAQTPPATTVSEVRWSESGWGPDNDRNLVVRFSTQTFTVPRLGSVQNYFLRQYDASSPTRYSRYSAALHLNHPLMREFFDDNSEQYAARGAAGRQPLVVRVTDHDFQHEVLEKLSRLETKRSTAPQNQVKEEDEKQGGIAAITGIA